MGAFIVRPFGVKKEMDFDRMERELILPVLEELGIDGATTAEITRAGNIRTDMFECLLVSDIVIADISIHNANVYYELGIRHALRPRSTILIRARVDEIPFDLRTDRYLEYVTNDPGGSREKLADAIRQSQRADNADSPVFLLLPGLKATDPERFRPVPEAFSDAVSIAQGQQDLPMLAVLGEEAQGLDWGVAGSRLVGRAQFDLSAWPDARATWEWVRRERPGDPEANLLLGTVLQRLGNPVASTAAIERVLAHGELQPWEQAEARALLGRNAKDRWISEWSAASPEARAASALSSPFLEEALSAYDEAFLANQNHWYSGLNALALAVVQLRLAERKPDVWAASFEDEEEAQRELERRRRKGAELEAAVSRSLDADAFRRRGEGYNVWAELSRADLRLLTSDRPDFVAAAYKKARARLAEETTASFPAESAARQIRLYIKLGLFAENAAAALGALGVPAEAPAPPPRARIIVFSGHRIDAPGRPEPRFPPESEQRAADMIREAVAAERKLAGSRPIEGIAGGASGGDILFHEICADLGIPTTLLLALPKEQFAAESVIDAGPDWIERFRRLCEGLGAKVLSDSKELPAWLAVRPDYSIWQRNNRWTLHMALSRADTDVTLIVLWDGKGGDGPGGTQDMVDLAKSRGVKVVLLDAKPLAAAATRSG